MDKSASQVIKEYYEKVKDDYPDVSFFQFNNACRSSFKFVVKEIDSGNLRSIKLIFFGTFLVYEKRASGLLARTKRMFADNVVSQDILNHIDEIVKRFFSRK